LEGGGFGSSQTALKIDSPMEPAFTVLFLDEGV